MKTFDEVEVGDTIYQVALPYNLEHTAIKSGKVVAKTGTRLLFAERHWESLRMNRGGFTYFMVGKTPAIQGRYITSKEEAKLVFKDCVANKILDYEAEITKLERLKWPSESGES